MTDKNTRKQFLKAEDIAKSVLEMIKNVKTEEDIETVKNKIAELKPVRDSLG